MQKHLQFSDLYNTPSTMRLYLHPYYNTWYIEFRRGKHRSLRTKDEKLARQTFAKIEREWLKGRLVELDESARKITLGNFKTLFLSSHTDLADRTIAAYELSLRLLCDSLGASTLLNRVPANCKKFVDDCKARGVKPVSINTYLRHIKAALYWAHEERYLKRKPKIKMLRISKRLPRVLSRQEIAAVLRYARRQDFEMYRVITFALWTGARRAEISSAKWENVLEESIKLTGKTGERIVPLLPMAVHSMGPQKDIGIIFKKCHIDTITHRFKSICREIKVEGVHFHNLRHTSATMMLSKGVQLPVVQKILGHASITTTQIYADVIDEVLRREMHKMCIRRE